MRFFIRLTLVATRVFHLLLILALAIFVCFWNLSQGSLSHRDETTHALATQSMMLSGDFWNPSVGHGFYYGKPPFKMWLSIPFIEYFGQSSFSFRFLDAAIGVGLCLLLWAISWDFFRSSGIGLLATIALLGCYAFVHNHGPRTGVQDAMAVFLQSLVIFCGWKVSACLPQGSFSPSPKLDRQMLSWSMGFGVFLGLALMTKSIAVLQAPLIFALFILLSGDALRLLRQWRAWSLMLFPALLIAAPYFASHCLERWGFCRGLLGLNPLERVVSGTTKAKVPWFYWQRLVIDRAAVPPELLAAALLFALFLVLRRGNRALLLLLIWATLPVVLFTVSKSHFTWYIALAYPAMSLLVAFLLMSLIEAAGRLRPTAVAFPVALPCFAFVAYGFFALGQNLYQVFGDVLQDKPEEEIQQVVTSINALSHGKGSQPEVLSYNYPKFDRQERVYQQMLESAIKPVSKLELLGETLGDSPQAFIFTNAHELINIMPLRQIAAVAFLRPWSGRRKWSLVLAYGASSLPPLFEPTVVKRSFGELEFPVLYGLSDREPTDESRRWFVRWTQGPRAAFTVDGNWGHTRLGARASLRLALPKPVREELGASPELRVSFNGEEVLQLSVENFELVDYSFNIPATLWEVGKNVCRLNLALPAATPIPRNKKVLLLDSVMVSLAQPEPIA